MTVTKDATARIYLPAANAEWTELLSGTGINVPSSFWVAAQASGTTIADLGTGGRTVNIVGSPTLGAAAPGWTATGVKCTDNSGSQWLTFTIPNVTATSGMLLQCFGLNTNPASGSRMLGLIGASTYQASVLIPGSAGPKLRARSGVNTTDGQQEYQSILVVVTKFDRANSVQGTYTRGERIKATYTAPGGATQAFMCGEGAAATDATLVYAAYWTGADAEIADGAIQTLLDTVYGLPDTTLAALQAGSTALKWVVAIEGYPRLLTDATPGAVLNAWAATDWTQALDGLVVELRNQQSADPNNPFSSNGTTCTLHVTPDRADTFGIEVNRRGSGAWTTITSTIDRDDLALGIKSNVGFASSGEAYIGTECVEYSGTTASTMTLTKRGKYSAEGTDPTGSSVSRFSAHHRVTLDQQQVRSNPVISQQPRRWIGRRVYVYLHKVDANGNLNSKANAQRVFAGRIQAIADDPNTLCTTVSCSHLMNEIGEAIICRNQWSATAMHGIYIPTGASFTHKEFKYPSGVAATKTANALTVVASSASGTNQINAGYYSLEEICSFLNYWLAGEKVAARIDGTYSWASPMTMSDGLRSKVDWMITDASSTVPVAWTTTVPAGVSGYLGFSDVTPPLITGTAKIGSNAADNPITNGNYCRVGQFTPWRFCVFGKGGPGGSLPTFKVTTENECGTFVDTYELMPSIVKPSMDSSLQWGLFLVDEKILIQASYSNGILSNCFITPFGQTSAGDSNSPQAFYTLGRRADDDSGPVKIRQVFDIECSFKELMNILFYSTGTANYNHGTYDTRAYGFGIGVPGQLLGDPFERSVANLPHADQVMRIRFDQPTKLADLIGGELVARRAFPVWKNGGIVFQKWHTPEIATSTFTLTEANKAAPVGNTDNHRTPTLETAAFSRPVVKFNFDPDTTFGRDVRYRASMQLEDQVAVDDGGGDVPSPMTINLRNTQGKDDPAILSSYLATMPLTSRPSKYLVRSIDVKLFENVAPGDTCTVVDAFARDPALGTRSMTRPATVVRHSCDFGGPSPGGGGTRGMAGEVEVNFFDVQRGALYGPSADIDDTAGAGGFSAGYNSGTLTIRTKDHSYSEASEAIDAAGFPSSGKVVIVERDPPDPTAPLTWSRTIAVNGVVGHDITLTAALSSPAWDATKKYRVIFDHYSVATALQQDYAFQADDANEQVESIEDPYHFSSTTESVDWTPNVTAAAEFVATLSYGDGKSWDVGHENAIIKSINALYDYKTAHQSANLWSERKLLGSTNQWYTTYFGILYFGQENLTIGTYRSVTLAPWFALDNLFGAGTGSVRITVSRDLPQSSFNGFWQQLDSPVFTENYAQNTWTTSTTTFATGTPATFSLLNKDLSWGLAYVTIEVKDAKCHGLAKGIEGPRQSRIPFGLNFP